MSDNHDSNIGKSSTVTLREVTKENLHEILNLDVAPDQKNSSHLMRFPLPKPILTARLPGSAPSTPMRPRLVS